MGRLAIDRCLCFGKPFAELAVVAAGTDAETVAELQEHALFGRKCALCHPYVRRMLRTGETAFHHVVTDEDEPEAGASQPKAGASQPEVDAGQPEATPPRPVSGAATRGGVG